MKTPEELLNEIEAWLCFNTTPNAEDTAKVRQSIKECLSHSTIIKAKALRKNGTNKWYQIDYVALDDGSYPFRTRRLPDLWHDEYRKDGIGFVAESNLPSDAELIDIEIIVKAGGER